MPCCNKRKQLAALKKKREQRIKQLNEMKKEKMKQKARNETKK